MSGSVDFRSENSHLEMSQLWGPAILFLILSKNGLINVADVTTGEIVDDQQEGPLIKIQGWTDRVSGQRDAVVDVRDGAELEKPQLMTRDLQGWFSSLFCFSKVWKRKRRSPHPIDREMAARERRRAKGTAQHTVAPIVDPSLVSQTFSPTHPMHY